MFFINLLYYFFFIILLFHKTYYKYNIQIKVYIYKTVHFKTLYRLDHFPSIFGSVLLTVPRWISSSM